MKKIVLLLSIFLMLVSCTEKANDFDIDSKAVDMSIYEGVDAVKHCFKETSVAELTRTLKESGSGVFYIGYKECAHCQELVKYLNEVGMEMGATIYYIPGTDKNGNFTITGDIYDELLLDLDPILDEDKDGNKAIYTPHVFSVINGKFVKSIISGSVDNDNEIKELKSEYRKILEPFKK